MTEANFNKMATALQAAGQQAQQFAVFASASAKATSLELKSQKEVERSAAIGLLKAFLSWAKSSCGNATKMGVPLDMEEQTRQSMFLIRHFEPT